MKAFRFTLILIVSMFAGSFAGCTADGKLNIPNSDQVAQVQAAAHAARDATTQAIAEAHAQLAALPANDPERIRVESVLSTLEVKLGQVDQALKLADAMAASLASGQLDPAVSQGITAIGGPYGSLIALAVGGVFGIYHAIKAGKVTSELTNVKTAFEQVVQSVDVALPAKTPEQKRAMSMVQDAATKDLVADVRGA